MSAPQPPATGGTSRAEIGATAALAGLTVVSTLAFARVFTTAGWLGPAVACALAAHGLSWWLRRRHVGLALALSVSLLGVAVLGAYLIFPEDLSFGLPLGHVFHALGHALQQAGNGMDNAITPVPSAPGYAILVTWGAGGVAVLGDLLAFRLRTPLPALAPGLGLFLTASAIGTARGRGWSVGTEVGAMVVFLLAERVAGQRATAHWLGGRTPGTGRSMVTAGAFSAAVAVVAAVALTPAVPSREGDGILGWRSGPGSGGGTRITPSPFDDLRTRLLNNPDTVVMTVVSSQPSYWRLTSLDDFDGTVWSANDAYQSVTGQLPGVRMSPGTRQVQETFHITALDSIWLPTGFNPEAVHDAGTVSWDPLSGSLISAKSTSNGEAYEVAASEQLGDLSPALLSADTPLRDSQPPQQDLGLPSNVPDNVLALAQHLTAGDNTEYTKAYALEQYFHRAPFVYSTNPPSDDSADALATFLFKTHAGYCQQFAGAFAVLARSVGLPTRIAIGFQTGTLSDGVYTVTDADAHAWPEVWFPNVGWVPFEPTPGRQVPDAPYTGVTDNTQSGVAPTPTSTTVTVPVSSGVVTRTKVRAPAEGVTPTTTAASAAGSGGRPAIWALVVALVAALVAGWIVLLVGIRRVRWRRRRNRAQQRPMSGASLSPPSAANGDPYGSDPSARRQVLVAWAETAELLARWQLRRRSDETVSEFAARAGAQFHGLAGDEPDVRLRRLAALVQIAEFSGAELSSADAREAQNLARLLISWLRRAMPRTRRLEHFMDPREALHPSLEEIPTAAIQPTATVGPRPTLD